MPQSKDEKLVVWQLALSLHDLFDELYREGFREIHSPGFQLRTAELLNRLQTEVPLKYALASLVCHSTEAQEKFYRVFDGFVSRFKPIEGEQPPPDQIVDNPQAPAPVDTPVSLPPIPGQSGGILPERSAERAPDLAVAARSGPVTIELRFRDDGFRPWNLPELEPALRPFREKEWADSEDWDIPASIQKTMRRGGSPGFVRKQKRRAPQYLFLIQQKSVRDHLAAFYADLVKELLRRDVDADFFFYGDEPTRCWRDRRVPSSFTTLDRLFPIHKNSRLILIGEANGLLTPLRIYPSPLVFQLKETWRDMALLNTRSTALWGAEEETLCRLFPVVPANIVGLGSLFGQWERRQSFTPAYWKSEHAESVPPNLTMQGSDPEWVSKTLHNLKVYLGKYGITWLCAICVYPEIYWQMTKILHDEAISPVDVPEETRRNQIWHNALLQLSRLEWLRQGNIPPEFRQKMRNLLPTANAIEVRKELLRMLNWDENAAKDKDSYAYQDREYTIALLQHEQLLKSQPTISESEKVRLNADFRERLDKQGITMSDIADAVGRDFFKKLPSKPQAFQVLWVDDYPENNTLFIDAIKKTLELEFKLVKSTEEALEQVQKQSFDAIISDLGRGKAEWAGVDLLQALKSKENETPVAIFASKRAVENRTMLLQEGAQLATNSFAEIEAWIRRLFVQKFEPKEPGFWVLWIDDQPENNASFQEKMTELMFARFVTAVDTEQALKAFSERDFDLIISDMGRGDNPRAGVDTLKVLREQGINTKLAFFTRSKHAAQYKEEMELLGATDVVSGRDAQQAYLSERVMELQGKSVGKDADVAFFAELERESSAVCRIWDATGKPTGTGFLTRDGYLFTANNVIKTARFASGCFAEFGVSAEETGKGNSIERYRLDAEDFTSSPPEQLNFTRIKVIEGTGVPLSRWGYIELETSKIPLVGETLSLIHHPEGGNKAIEANAAQIFGQLDHHLYYSPITRPGSGGAPLLDKNLKAVALHLSRNVKGDGYVVNEKGEKRQASQGVLIRDVLALIEAAKTEKAKTLEISKQASFPGGEEAMMQYITNNLEYPSLALEYNIEGTVYISFVVDKDGSILNIEVIKDIGGGCGKAGMDVVKSMPKWIPGEANGQTVKMSYTLPIHFQLEQESHYLLALEQKKLGKSALEKGQVEEARKAFNAAIDLFQGGRDLYYDEADITYELALLEKSAGNNELALSLFERAYTLFVTMGHQGTLDAINVEMEGLLKLKEEKERENTKDLGEKKANESVMVEEMKNEDALKRESYANTGNIADQYKKRLSSLEDAIERLEVSLRRDNEELEFQRKKMNTSEGKLESQIRDAKIKMIEERAKEKRERLFELNKSYNDVQSQAAIAHEKEAKIKNTEKIQPKVDVLKEEHTIAEQSKVNITSVYISYNHQDKEVVDQITAYLKERGILVIIDQENLKPGEDIRTFIEESIRNADYVISIVSRNSLLSGWVNIDTTETFKSEKSTGLKKWLPCILDYSFADSTFYFDAIERIDSKINELKENIKKAKRLKSSTVLFDIELKRQQDLRNNLPDTIERLKNTFSISIVNEQFESGMSKVLERIKQ